MKLIKRLPLLIPFCLFWLTFSTGFAPLAGCTKTKTVTVTDTTTVTIRDTITVQDTVIVTDTLLLGNLTDGLIAYFNFNGGNLNDSSGNNNNIVFSSATPTADRFGNLNNA